MEERQRKYRQLFDAYLREFGLIKRTFSIYGIGDLRWIEDRRTAILKFVRDRAKGQPPP
jgi:hypothetical protein